MKQSIRIISVIGGTGKAGKYVVKNLLEQGFKVKLLLRNSERLTLSESTMEIITGDARDLATIIRLIEGSDAVISTLGLGLPASPPTIFTRVTSHIISAMQEGKQDRLIVLTGVNVDVPGDHKGPYALGATRWMHENYPESTMNRQEEYSILQRSKVNWTLVRVPLIRLSDLQSPFEVSLTNCDGQSISSTSLAMFIIGQLSDETYSRKAPFVFDKTD